MKNTFISLLTFLFAIYSKYSDAQQGLSQQWNIRYGGYYNDLLRDMIPTTDYGYLLAGVSFSPVSGEKSQPNWDATNQTSDIWLLKTNQQGQKIWDMRYGGTSREDLSFIKRSTDGGYILGGTTYSDLGGDISQPLADTIALQPKCDYWIFKIDSNGNKLWDKRYGGLGADNLADIQSTKDGGYILAGNSQSPTGGNKTHNNWAAYPDADYWIVKIDATGNQVWDKTYGGTLVENLHSVTLTPDGGYLLGGISFSDSTGNKTQANWDTSLTYSDIWLVKIDSSGNKIWDKRFGGTSADYLYCQLADSTGYILAGGSTSLAGGDKTQSTLGNGADFWLLKIDLAGNKIWDKTIGGNGNEKLSSIYRTTDNGYILCGLSASSASRDKSENNLGALDVWIVKVDSMANIQWDKTIFTADSSEVYPDFAKAVQMKDSCYTIASHISGMGGYCNQPNRDPGYQSTDYWLIKFCATLTGLPTYTNNAAISLFPNPAFNQLAVFLTSYAANDKLQIQSLIGQPLTDAIPIVSNQTLIDISFLPAGIYLAVLQSNEQRIVKRFIKQ